MDFKEANKTVHPVEKQWHYATLTEFGFEPIDKEGIGFVRSYSYKKGNRVITCTTGSSGDYWRDETDSGGCWSAGSGGWWSNLRPYLEKLFEHIKEDSN